MPEKGIGAIVNLMTDYELIENDSGIKELLRLWERDGIESVAMDFEGEFNLHIYGEHLCLIQLFDHRKFYIIDAMKLSADALRLLLESPVEKIMFDCTGDSTLVRRSYKIRLNNVFDLRVLAKALGFENGLTALEERNLSLSTEGKSEKKKKQMSNWLTRPLKEEQISYALDDVRHLFELKDSLTSELREKNPKLFKSVMSQMPRCAEPLHPDKMEWERAPGYKRMPKNTRIYLKQLYMARDEIARARNCPASYLIDKKTLNKMAFAEALIPEDFLRPLHPSEMDTLEKAITEAKRQL